MFYCVISDHIPSLNIFFYANIRNFFAVTFANLRFMTILRMQLLRFRLREGGREGIDGMIRQGGWIEGS